MNGPSLAAAFCVGAALIVTTPAQPRPEGPFRPRAAAPLVEPAPQAIADGEELFRTSDRCLACHKGVTSSDGLDVSIGFDWRASMMANSARDPYWQAAVRREVIDHPDAADAIEDKCSSCHMPMARASALADGRSGSVFDHLPVGADPEGEAAMAADGVGCALCHQITPTGLGTESSFSAGFEIATETPPEGRTVYGPFEPDTGGVGIMHSATGFRPTEGTHVQSSELCATCHTLFTHAIQPDGSEGAEFAEQAPYLEWQASSFEGDQSCQDCHMPEVAEDVPVTAVLGRSRPNVSRHVFRGGNFFMLRMLNRYRAELGVVALPQEMALAVERTERHLKEETATVSVANARLDGGVLELEVDVRNLAGHKFPTAYPSRRAWLHVTIEDAAGAVVFESGAFSPDGSIAGNDHDEDPRRFEPHYRVITRPDQVQVYEAVMVDGSGQVTTGLMSAERWTKDNRLLPAGFDRGRADPRVRVIGPAAADADFSAGGDRIRYSVDVGSRRGPFTARVALRFQPIAYRWAQNLAGYDAFETERFVRYYESMASVSAISVAETSVVVR